LKKKKNAGDDKNTNGVSYGHFLFCLLSRENVHSSSFVGQIRENELPTKKKKKKNPEQEKGRGGEKDTIFFLVLFF